MRDSERTPLGEDEFDALLKNSLPDLPPQQVVDQVTPWKQAMTRVLTGIGLTTITLNFWWLNYLLPAIGMALMLLGFRALRRENRWFSLCFGITVFRAVYLYAGLVLGSTIWSSKLFPSPAAYGLAGVHLVLQFIQFFCLWGGLRAVQRKAGLPPRAGGGVALMVWYGITGLLATAGYTGLVLPLALLVSYICILRSLWKLSKELDQAGYAIRPAPVRITDAALSIAISAVVLTGCICGLLLGCSYPMNWQAAAPAEHSDVEEIKARLLELGFPDDVLRDLTAQDIAACDGALRVVTDVQDHFMSTREKEPLRITGVAVELAGEQERWMIFHHFLWPADPGFYGTESIQLWPAYQDSEGWQAGGRITGRVLYDKNGQTYSAPYYFLGEQTFTSESIFWGQETSTDVFAAFSMPGAGERHRGYVAYPVAEVRDGHLISSWCNYTHQRTALQYPAMTAMEKRMAGGWNSDGAFYTIQDALQFRPTEEQLALLS